MAESQSQTERRPETPGASDAISYIRFGMDLATRSDMQELRVEFNERLDGTNERRGAAKLRRIAANEQPADAIIERLNGLIADVESLRATVKRVGWILGTLIVVGGAVNVALMIFG